MIYFNLKDQNRPKVTKLNLKNDFVEYRFMKMENHFQFR